MYATVTRGGLPLAGLGAALVLQVLVLYAPTAPGPPSPVPHVDKVVHALVFALPVLVAGLSRMRIWPVVTVLVALHAPLSEAVQHVVLPRRSGDPWDVLADLVGVGIAVGAVRWGVRRPRRRR